MTQSACSVRDRLRGRARRACGREFRARPTASTGRPRLARRHARRRAGLGAPVCVPRVELPTGRPVRKRHRSPRSRQPGGPGRSTSRTSSTPPPTRRRPPWAPIVVSDARRARHIRARSRPGLRLRLRRAASHARPAVRRPAWRGRLWRARLSGAAGPGRPGVPLDERIAACAAQLGPSRDFYTTADVAHDVRGRPGRARHRAARLPRLRLRRRRRDRVRGPLPAAPPLARARFPYLPVGRDPFNRLQVERHRAGHHRLLRPLDALLAADPAPYGVRPAAHRDRACRTGHRHRDRARRIAGRGDRGRVRRRADRAQARTPTC